jgi:hypothetical protein
MALSCPFARLALTESTREIGAPVIYRNGARGGHRVEYLIPVLTPVPISTEHEERL